MLTPQQLREQTALAKQNAADSAAARAAEHEDRRFKAAIEAFEKEAVLAANERKTEAVGFECVVPDSAKSIEDLPPVDRAMFDRLKKHYEGRGFTTRIHGPYGEGSMSKRYRGMDLVVGW